MAPHALLRDLVEADAFDAGRGAGEEGLDEIRAQSDRIENLRAAVGLIGRDAHLGHHLEQPLVDRLDVALDDFLLVELLRQLALHRGERLEGEIGIDRLGAVAGEAGEVVNFARLAGFHDEADRGAQALADQMVMDRGAGEQRGDRNAVRAGIAVGQDDDVDAVAQRLFGLIAQEVDRSRQTLGAEVGVPGGVEGARLEVGVAHLGDRADLLQILVGEDRLVRLEALNRRHALEIEQVRARPDDRYEAHDELLADRIDRRVRHLGKVLLEVGEQELRPVGQRRDRRVVAHRADRFLAGGPHRRHQDLEVFLGVAEGLLAIEQREVRQRRPGVGRRQLLELDQRVLQPLLVGVAAGELGLDLLVGNEAAFLEVDEEHLAGLQAPLGDDLAFRDLQHAHLRRHDDAVVAGDEIARRAQAVAVERRADLPPVGEGDRGRPVPRLHQAGVVLVEGAPLLVHQRIAGPRLGNHHHHGVRERIAALHQELERVVEAGGVRLAFIGDRPQLRDVVAVIGRARRGLPRRHPVAVAAQRVDLAVVGDHAVGMRQRPGREGVGGETLVHQRERADEIRLVQVGVVGAELIGEEHALVDHGAARHRDRVIAEGAPLAHGVEASRDRLAQEVEAALELVLGELAAALADEDLLVHRLGRLDGLAERRVVGRHLAPAEELHAFGRDLLGIDLARFPDASSPPAA